MLLTPAGAKLNGREAVPVAVNTEPTKPPLTKKSIKPLGGDTRNGGAEDAPRGGHREDLAALRRTRAGRDGGGRGNHRQVLVRDNANDAGRDHAELIRDATRPESGLVAAVHN